MATIKLDSYVLKNNCVPRINDLIDSLNNAKNYLAYNSLPSDFKYRSTLDSVIDTINSCINNLKEVKKYISECNSSFDNILQDTLKDSGNLPTKIITRR